MTPKKQTIRSGTYAADFVAVEEGLAFVVWGLDLGDFEEIECFPLLRVSNCRCEKSGSWPKLRPFHLWQCFIEWMSFELCLLVIRSWSLVSSALASKLPFVTTKLFFECAIFKEIWGSVLLEFSSNLLRFLKARSQVYLLSKHGFSKSLSLY
jgi:hypothetical protein